MTEFRKSFEEENAIFLPILEKIDTYRGKKRLIIAIDGGSASGKTTLSKSLEKIYDATVLHMDDFFLTPDMRTEKRLSEVGGNVSWERFEGEVLLPLTQEKEISYRAFDCKTEKFKETTVIAPQKIVIIEGAYSMHMALAGYYDFSVFLNINKNEQKKRILNRNPSLASRFFDSWIPMEDNYFEKTNIKNRCDLVINI